MYSVVRGVVVLLVALSVCSTCYATQAPTFYYRLKSHFFPPTAGEFVASDMNNVSSHHTSEQEIQRNEKEAVQTMDQKMAVETMSEHDAAVEARRIIRSGRYGLLSTALTKEFSPEESIVGLPMSSVEMFVESCEKGEDDIFILSSAAELNTKNIGEESQATFLVQGIFDVYIEGKNGHQAVEVVVDGPRLRKVEVVLMGSIHAVHKEDKDFDKIMRCMLSSHREIKYVQPPTNMSLFRMKISGGVHLVDYMHRFLGWVPLENYHSVDIQEDIMQRNQRFTSAKDYEQVTEKQFNNIDMVGSVQHANQMGNQENSQEQQVRNMQENVAGMQQNNYATQNQSQNQKHYDSVNMFQMNPEYEMYGRNVSDQMNVQYPQTYMVPQHVDSPMYYRQGQSPFSPMSGAQMNRMAAEMEQMNAQRQYTPMNMYEQMRRNQMDSTMYPRGHYEVPSMVVQDMSMFDRNMMVKSAEEEAKKREMMASMMGYEQYPSGSYPQNKGMYVPAYNMPRTMQFPQYPIVPQYPVAPQMIPRNMNEFPITSGMMQREQQRAAQSPQVQMAQNSFERNEQNQQMNQGGVVNSPAAQMVGVPEQTQPQEFQQKSNIAA